MTLFPIGHLTEISLFADVLSIIIIVHAIVFSENLPGYSNMCS